jgi:hypothetical protein
MPIISLRNRGSLDSPFFEPTLQYFLYAVLMKQDTKKFQFNFGDLLYAQELVMLFAHLDALISDSIRVICRREPRLLYRDKKMSWKSIIESANWQNIFEKMIEEYSYEIGWKSIKEKVLYLQSEHGLSFSISSTDLDELDKAEEIRHLVIHNGNRVSQEYLERTKRTDVFIGDIIPIASDYVQYVSHQVQFLGCDIFCTVAEKFFHVDPSKLTGVFRKKTETG